ncbi:MAG: ABC transporter permease [Anaerolineae bacterium]|nr:ABC transporter permease [Anaerolineae bacterium]
MIDTMYTVLLKETRDLLRDRGTLLVIFATPFALTLLYLVAALLLALYTLREARQGLPIALINGDQLPGLQAVLEKSRALKLVPAPPDVDDALHSGELALVLTVPEGAAAALAAGHPITLTLTVGYAGLRSDLAVTLIQSFVEDYGDQIVSERLAQHGLDPSWLKPVRLQYTSPPAEGIAAAPTLTGEALPNLLSLLFIPYLVTLWTFSGGIDMIAHLTVGEKERHTLEALLVTPADRVGLVLGKVTFSVIVSLVSAALWSLNTLPYLWIFSTTFARIGSLTGTVGLRHIGLSVVWLTLLIAPLIVMIAGLITAIGGLARSVREAGYIMTAVRLLLPALAFLVVLTVDTSPPLAIYTVPIIGVLVAMRDLWGGGIAPGLLLLTWLAAAIYAGLAIYLAAYLFSREWVLWRGL